MRPALGVMFYATGSLSYAYKVISLLPKIFNAFQNAKEKTNSVRHTLTLNVRSVDDPMEFFNTGVNAVTTSSHQIDQSHQQGLCVTP